MTKNYFTYGSNMLVCRLRKRVPSAKAIGACTLPAHDLRFHKRSSDGSGKCDAFCTCNENDAVIGRLFTIDVAEEKKLDKYEGYRKGYEKKPVCVFDENGETQKAFTYYADAKYIDGSLAPYTWYKHHVLAGAEEGDLPADYINKKIKAVKACNDLKKCREKKEMALHNCSKREVPHG